MKRLLFSLLLLTPLALAVVAQDKPARSDFGLAVFKLGEKAASDDKAGPTIDSLCSFLGKSVDGATFARRGVRNMPDEALKLLQDKDKPVAMAIVSPGFYFKHRVALKLTVLAEARRDGNDGEQYVLLGKESTDQYPQGATVATSLTADTDWLNKAVLPAPKDAKAIVWKQYDNLFDAAYAMVDGEKDAPKYVLADRISLKSILDDPELKGLKQGLKSELLPQELVVEVDSRLGDKRDAIKKVLKELDKTPDGKKQGENLQSATFPAPDDKRLEKVAKLYE